MDWTRIIDAANGRPQSLAWVVRLGLDADAAALQTLLLLEEAPHPAAALVAAAGMVRRCGAQMFHAALAPYVAPALADWRADPDWDDRAVGGDAWGQLKKGVAVMSGALRADPAALHDAVAIVVRHGGSEAVAHCFDALGADGWRALTDDLGGALLARADPADLGRVWDALTDAQRAAAVEAASSRPPIAARLIGSIGAAAWTATDPMLRERIITTVLRDQSWVFETAPAWPGMTDDERARLARAVIERGNSWSAFHVLKNLGAAGRATLTDAQRAALDERAKSHSDGWLVLAWRAADAGWTTLTADERAAVLAAAEEAPWRVAVLLRAVGAAGWTAMCADDRERIIAIMRRTTEAFFRCPPALWVALAGADLPRATEIPEGAIKQWRGEDADADLDGLPPSHQAVVLALAPWRPEDAASDSVRMQRLRAAWNQTSADERVALVTAAPFVLPSVAVAARRRGGVSAAVDAVGATVARVASATGGADAKRAVGAMLRTPADWRAWMIAFVPTADDPPDVREAWRAAARRGVIADLALCARLAATERRTSESRRGALRRRARAPRRGSAP